MISGIRYGFNISALAASIHRHNRKKIPQASQNLENVEFHFLKAQHSAA